MAAGLLAAVLLIAACGLIYELVAGALASYLLGDSVTQFSTVIGTYLFAMGIGSWLSRFVVRNVAERFVGIELLVGAVGGFSSTLLFLAFGYTDGFRVALYTLVLIIGTLVGLEIPLLMRILRERFDFKDTVANVLTFDYLGALGASLLFPIVLMPHLGLIRTALLFGLINAAVALWTTFLLEAGLRRPWRSRAACLVVLAALGVGMAGADRLMNLAEGNIYADEVIYSRTSPYQRIVLTAWRDDLRLFLSSHLQFSSRDEYRYHEALVHPALAARPNARRVLVLGGGDGLAVREILKYPHVEQVTLVELDPDVVRLFSTHAELRRLNRGSFDDPRVRVENADAFPWLDEGSDLYDVAFVDFPDPSNFSVGKLYTTTFYHRLMRRLTPDGVFVVQSTSPLFARQAFWCVVETIRAAGARTWPYHVYVPSFGEWGFVLASRGDWSLAARFPADLRFLTADQAEAMFEFPPDMAAVPADVNRLNNQALVHYYEREWSKVSR
jgi:spermidine synthase